MSSNRNEQEYIVYDVDQEPDEVRVYRFLHGLVPFEFTAGQFVVARLSSHPDLRASLTLASSPGDREGFEVMVKRTGEFGSQFYDAAEIGSSVLFTAPTGPFSPPSGSTDPLCFLAHDYTVPAARSMLFALREAGATRRMMLLHELEHEDRAVFASDFSNPRYEGFEWVRVGPEGIDEAMLRSHLERPQDWLFLIQAEGAQCKRLTATVNALGIDPKRVTKERWS